MTLTLIPVPAPTLPRCPCGAPAFTFTPGTEPEIGPGGIVVRRGRPDRGWCEAHAPWVRGWQSELFDVPASPSLPTSN